MLIVYPQEYEYTLSMISFITHFLRGLTSDMFWFIRSLNKKKQDKFPLLETGIVVVFFTKNVS